MGHGQVGDVAQLAGELHRLARPGVAELVPAGLRGPGRHQAEDEGEHAEGAPVTGRRHPSGQTGLGAVDVAQEPRREQGHGHVPGLVPQHRVVLEEVGRPASGATASSHRPPKASATPWQKAVTAARSASAGCPSPASASATSAPATSAARSGRPSR